ncbi:DUF4123 domain-containing protein [Pseudomonas sp. EA_35y_Pfl2_R5]|jgi:hypothetical protein|uniref:DUF4123 domain-containing protein n=1 Tax=Pseudomonas sp. EA_35y_Pfl2_R5 TaxID=3088690 RepID=UPI0030D7A754
MIEVAQDWLTEQLAQQRELVLIIDSLAEPDPIKALFAADLMQDYVNLYQGTEFTDMAEVGPWLVRLHNSDAELIQTLLNTPESDWGWLASAEHIDLATLTQHWQERLLVDEQEQRAFYRFQDNRVIARHLAQLSEAQHPLLLGPLNSALCWDGQAWQSINNPHPALYPAPFDKPWQELAEPETVSQAVLRHNLEQWLWQNHSAATAQLAETQPLSSWLDTKLEQAQSWQWQSLERIQFLLRYQLDPALAEHPAWAPVENETADAHFARSSKELFTASVQA